MNQTTENNVTYNITNSDLELKKRVLASNLSEEDKITIIERLKSSYYDYYPIYPSPNQIWYSGTPKRSDDDFTHIYCSQEAARSAIR